MRYGFVFFLLLFPISIYAQQWTGSTTTDGTISRGGKVGIGISDPEYPLHIKSPSNANIKIEGGTSGYADIRLRSGTDPDVNGWQIWTDASNNYLDFFHTTSKMTLMPDGYLGIGTNDPIDQLHIKSALNTSLRLEGGGNGYANIRLRSGTDPTPSGWEVWTDPVNNHLDFFHGGSKMTLLTNGRLGVGTSSPSAFFEVNKASNDFWTAFIKNGGGNSKGLLISNGYGGNPANNEPTILQLEDNDGAVRMKVQSNGKVGIGTASPDSRLTVKGDIHAEEVKVDLSVPGPDYVFEEDYDLPTLKSVQNYIRENKHLPEVPSAQEMEKNGIDLGEMNMLLLKKVEELTLYILDINRKVQTIESENRELKQEIRILKQSNQ
ncbi:hypothetical protein FNH22_24040 [Fulvivirga sp. M361]|uniref:tail fiber protein n=1 Tax=Fulvivirga sp. M361 TaxID=2594266 RepID=UPI001179FF81|nr:tail fiber protein [Fulvivirga sp. M361]TRX51635.1 hypothetical protein FNH22_24040 [Fulvivirga sp. M361]